MSIFNGKVEAPNTKWFATYDEAVEFAHTVETEGIQVRSDGYYVNYF